MHCFNYLIFETVCQVVFIDFINLAIHRLYSGFPGGSDGKEYDYNVRDSCSVPGSGRSLEKGMAAHSSILAWRIPWTEEPGRLQSMGSQRVRHDLATKQQWTIVEYLYYKTSLWKSKNSVHFINHYFKYLVRL